MKFFYKIIEGKVKNINKKKMINTTRYVFNQEKNTVCQRV